MKELRTPMLSTSFSEPAKCAKKRFSNILTGRKKRHGAAVLAALTASITLCGLCISCTSVGVIGGADGPTSIVVSDSRDLKKLYSCKMKYVGNASGLGSIVSLAPFMDGTSGMELYTENPPYGAGLYTTQSELTDSQKELFRSGAAVMICLVDNLDYVQLVNKTSGNILVSYTRDEIDASLPKTLREYSESYESFCELFSLLTDESAVTDNISKAILEYNASGYLEGECSGEGHITLGSEQSGENTIYYLLATYGNYGFENGRLVKVGGSGVIPTRLTLNASGEIVEYLTPEDGSHYDSSLRKMFPENYVKAAYANDSKNYAECTAKEEAYAAAYLKKIGRNAPIGIPDGERDKFYRLPEMDTQVSNQLLNTFYQYPYWLGTLERVENGKRCVYEKSWESNGENSGVVTFKKYDYDTNEILSLYVIKVNGSSMEYEQNIPDYSKQ